MNTKVIQVEPVYVIELDHVEVHELYRMMLDWSKQKILGETEHALLRALKDWAS